MGCSEDDVKINDDKIIKKIKKQNKELKKQVKELQEEKERYENLYDREYRTSLRLHQVEKDLTMEIGRLKDKVIGQNNRMLESQQDIIMALITKRDPRLDRRKLDMEQFSPKKYF